MKQSLQLVRAGLNRVAHVIINMDNIQLHETEGRDFRITTTELSSAYLTLPRSGTPLHTPRHIDGIF